MAILERRQLDPPPDGREVLFLLSWAQRAGEALHGELGEGGLLTPVAARRCLVGLLGRLMELCSDVFEAAKNAYMAEAEPLLALDPKLATLEQRDCGIDRELRELVGRVMPDCLGIPKCLVREGYGWCEYIEPGEVSSAAEVGRFYRRFGSACALMQALGGSDLHSSNWICSGGLPVLVDVETALSPVPRVFSDKRMFPELMAESESFLHDANRSLIPSSLLPSRLAGRELSVLLDDSGSSGCEPVLGGKRRSVLGFEAEFLSGFSEGYDRCLARRDELLRSLEGFSGVTVRRLLRDTSSYAKLLSRLHSPGR